MRRIGIFSWFGFSIPMEERFRMMKLAGFDSTMLWWGDEFASVDGPKTEHPELARKHGLFVENGHLSFEKANDLWFDNLAADELMELYARGLEECSEQGIPTAVLHLTEGGNPPRFTGNGLERIKRLVELAERKSVNIALENLRNPEYQEYILLNIPSARLGFCFDSGHQHCRTKEVDYLSLYGSRLMALHLHDNDESEDQHQVPGEGTIDWSLFGRKLKETGYNGAITLEVTNEFSRWKDKETPQEFLNRAYKAAVQLRSMM